MVEYLVVNKFSHVLDSDVGPSNDTLGCHQDLFVDDALLEVALLLNVELNVVSWLGSLLAWLLMDLALLLRYLLNSSLWSVLLLFCYLRYFFLARKFFSQVLRCFVFVWRLLFGFGLGDWNVGLSSGIFFRPLIEVCDFRLPNRLNFLSLRYVYFGGHNSRTSFLPRNLQRRLYLWLRGHVLFVLALAALKLLFVLGILDVLCRHFAVLKVFAVSSFNLAHVLLDLFVIQFDSLVLSLLAHPNGIVLGDVFGVAQLVLDTEVAADVLERVVARDVRDEFLDCIWKVSMSN